MPSIKCHQASASQARGPQGHPRWEMSFPSASRPSPTASQLCLRGSRERAPGTRAVISHCPPCLPLLDPQTGYFVDNQEENSPFLSRKLWGSPVLGAKSGYGALLSFCSSKTASPDYSPFK